MIQYCLDILAIELSNWNNHEICTYITVYCSWPVTMHVLHVATFAHCTHM